MTDSIINSRLVTSHALMPDSRLAKRTPGGNAVSRTNEQQALQKACADMESVFIYHLLKEMRSTIPDSGLTGEGGSMKEMYNHMTDSQLARELADNGGIGLSEILFRQLNRLAVEAKKNQHEKID